MKVNIERSKSQGKEMFPGLYQYYENGEDGPIFLMYSVSRGTVLASGSGVGRGVGESFNDFDYFENLVPFRGSITLSN